MAMWICESTSAASRPHTANWSTNSAAWRYMYEAEAVRGRHVQEAPEDRPRVLPLQRRPQAQRAPPAPRRAALLVDAGRHCVRVPTSRSALGFTKRKPGLFQLDRYGMQTWTSGSSQPSRSARCPGRERGRRVVRFASRLRARAMTGGCAGRRPSEQRLGHELACHRVHLLDALEHGHAGHLLGRVQGQAEPIRDLSATVRVPAATASQRTASPKKGPSPRPARCTARSGSATRSSGVRRASSTNSSLRPIARPVARGLVAVTTAAARAREPPCMAARGGDADFRVDQGGRTSCAGGAMGSRRHRRCIVLGRQRDRVEERRRSRPAAAAAARVLLPSPRVGSKRRQRLAGCGLGGAARRRRSAGRGGGGGGLEPVRLAAAAEVARAERRRLRRDEALVASSGGRAAAAPAARRSRRRTCLATSSMAAVFRIRLRSTATFSSCRPTGRSSRATEPKRLASRSFHDGPRPFRSFQGVARREPPERNVAAGRGLVVARQLHRRPPSRVQTRGLTAAASHRSASMRSGSRNGAYRASCRPLRTARHVGPDELGLRAEDRKAREQRAHDREPASVPSPAPGVQPATSVDAPAPRASSRRSSRASQCSRSVPRKLAERRRPSRSSRRARRPSPAWPRGSWAMCANAAHRRGLAAVAVADQLMQHRPLGRGSMVTARELDEERAEQRRAVGAQRRLLLWLLRGAGPRRMACILRQRAGAAEVRHLAHGAALAHLAERRARACTGSRGTALPSSRA